MTSLIIPAILLLLALRIWRRGGRERRVRIERLWVIPAVFAVLIGAGVAREPPPFTAPVLSVLIVALLLGLGVGWFRGRTTRITIDPVDHTLKGQTSATGLVLVAGLFLLRSVARDYLTAHASEWHLSPAEVVDGFMLFALGMIVGRRIEILFRCLRLLRQARSSGAGEGVSPHEISQDHA